MFASDHPGCNGAAARLPKKPGIQELTPPSSATAVFGAKANAQVSRNAIDVGRVIDIESPLGLNRSHDPHNANATDPHLNTLSDYMAANVKRKSGGRYHDAIGLHDRAERQLQPMSANDRPIRLNCFVGT